VKSIQASQPRPIENISVKSPPRYLIELADYYSIDKKTKSTGVVTKKLFLLAQHLKGIEIEDGHVIPLMHVVVIAHKWHGASVQFLPPNMREETCTLALIKSMTQITKPTIPIVFRALAALRNVPDKDLPVIPLAESFPVTRRLAGLHREMSRLSAGGVYYLGERDATKAHPTLTRDMVRDGTGLLISEEVIACVQKGRPDKSGKKRKASSYRYLRPDGQPDDEDLPL
jgi:hypothetical protein